MGEDAFGGAEEVRASGVGSGEGGPTGEGRAWQVEGEEDPPEEAFDAGTFAEFQAGSGGWQAGVLLGALGVPGDERQPPVGRIQTDDTGPQGGEPDGQGEQALGEGGVVGIGRPEQEHDGQAGTSAEQGMHPEAAQASRESV